MFKINPTITEKGIRMGFFYVLLALLLLAALLCFYPLILEVRLQGQGLRFYLQVFLFPFGRKRKWKIGLLHKTKYDLEQMALAKKAEPQKKQKGKKRNPLFETDGLLRAIRLQKTELAFSLGAEDAARTALFAGLLQGLLGRALAPLVTCCHKRGAFPRWRVQPVFDGWRLDYQGECILRSCIGDIIKENILKKKWRRIFGCRENKKSEH